jgi:hypothetical protein
MYYFVGSFDMIPEKVTEGDEWLEKVGLTFWAKQQGVSRVCVLKQALCGLPKRVLIIEATSMDALQQILDSPDRQKTRRNFEQYITNESHVTLKQMACSDKS